jgi:hypothetical protein
MAKMARFDNLMVDTSRDLLAEETAEQDGCIATLSKLMRTEWTGRVGW